MGVLAIKPPKKLKSYWLLHLHAMFCHDCKPTEIVCQWHWPVVTHLKLCLIKSIFMNFPVNLGQPKVLCNHIYLFTGRLLTGYTVMWSCVIFFFRYVLKPPIHRNIINTEASNATSVIVLSLSLSITPCRTILFSQNVKT